MELTEELRDKIVRYVKTNAIIDGIKLPNDETINEIINEEFLLYQSELKNKPKIKKELKNKPKTINYKLYRVKIHYSSSDNSMGGCEYYIVSAISKKNADTIGLDKFKKEYKKYSYNVLSVKSNKLKIPKFVRLVGEGVTSLL